MGLAVTDIIPHDFELECYGALGKLFNRCEPVTRKGCLGFVNVIHGTLAAGANGVGQCHGADIVS